MKTLEEGWKWYEQARDQVRLIRRLASNYWDDLPWEGKLDHDERFKNLDQIELEAQSRFTLEQMDDLAVLVLFSLFECQVRDRVASEIKSEVSQKLVTNTVLLKAVEDLIQQVEEGSFFRLLEPFKKIDSDLVEKVNQVRRYRNWVAHGRRGERPPSVDPATAYDRLTEFWKSVDSSDAV
jgi:hypothetical protein